jgi:hypothetical protein
MSRPIGITVIVWLILLFAAPADAAKVRVAW